MKCKTETIRKPLKMETDHQWMSAKIMAKAKGLTTGARMRTEDMEYLPANCHLPVEQPKLQQHYLVSTGIFPYLSSIYAPLRSVAIQLQFHN